MQSLPAREDALVFVVDEFMFENAVNTHLCNSFEYSFSFPGLPCCNRNQGCPDELRGGGQ